jgi:quercetin dioxygenase-like cupin family protein
MSQAANRVIHVAEVVRLIDLVNYQEGSVVSRTLINLTAATVTLFAFDEGQGLSEYTTPFDAVAHVLEGESEITVSIHGASASRPYLGAVRLSASTGITGRLTREG